MDDPGSLTIEKLCKIQVWPHNRQFYHSIRHSDENLTRLRKDDEERKEEIHCDVATKAKDDLSFIPISRGVGSAGGQTRLAMEDLFYGPSNTPIVLYLVARPQCALNRHFARQMTNSIAKRDFKGHITPRVYAIVRNDQFILAHSCSRLLSLFLTILSDADLRVLCIALSG